MVEIGDGAGFGQIGFGGFGAVHQLAMRHLDGDKPLQLVVVGEVNEAEPALAQNFLDPVATDVRRHGGSAINGGCFPAVRLEGTCFFEVVHSPCHPAFTSSFAEGDFTESTWRKPPCADVRNLALRTHQFAMAP